MSLIFIGVSPARDPKISNPIPAPEAGAQLLPSSPATHPPTRPAPVSPQKRLRKLLWAELMRQSLGIDPLVGPACQGRMRPIATLFRAEVLVAILRSLGLPPEPPRIRPSRGPPDPDLIEVLWS